MNIIWNVETVVQSSCDSQQVNIAPRDVWRGVRLSEPILNSFEGVHTVDITKDNTVFRNIPINWYMIEN